MSEVSQGRRTCRRCVLPESPPDITLDSEGLCSVCSDAQSSKPQPEEELLESDFTRLLGKHRGKHKYDCLVMCSGGKDSTASLYYMKKRYHLEPLAFTFDHGFETEGALRNVHKAVEKLDVDFLFFRSTFMRDMFAKIVTSGSGAILCHLCSMWYMQVALDVAARHEIPLVIAGWTKGQSARQGGTSNCACQAGHREYASMSEATRRFLATLRQDPKYRDFPQSMEEVLKRARKRHKAIVLSPHWFLNTHPDEYVELIRRELDWEYPDLSYPAKTTNCSLNFLAMHLSLKHYGYTHYHVEQSKLIRENQQTREEALKALEFNYPREFLASLAGRLGVELPE